MMKSKVTKFEIVLAIALIIIAVVISSHISKTRIFTDHNYY